MPPAQPNSPHRRASCDQCRQKKLKCDGETPSCGRCATVGETCEYSARLPMGRPKKRKAWNEGDQSSSTNTVVDASPSSIERESPTHPSHEIDMNMNQSGFDVDMTPQLTFDMSGNQTVWGCEINTAQDADPALLNVGSLSSKPSCSCLASLYLCLEETRATETLSFSAGLLRLRSVTARGLSILECSVCPTDFVWAMQNSQLLNTLLTSIAESYRKLVQSVEEEVQRAIDNNGNKTLFINESQPGFSDFGTADASFSAPCLQISLAPRQWEAIAKNAIKGDIFGSDSAAQDSFISLLQAMEERQRGWHSGTLPSCIRRDEHLTHRHSADKEPFCITLVKHTKGIIERLQLST